VTSEQPDHRNSVEFEAVLADAGYEVELISFDGGHTEPPELAVQTVMDTIGA